MYELLQKILQPHQTTNETVLLGNSIFGSDDMKYELGWCVLSLATQIKACSYDKMNIIKAFDRSGTSQNSGEMLELSME